MPKKRINGTVIEAKKDEDDGRMVYEIELRTKKGKAEIKIDVRTGKVLDVEFDMINMMMIIMMMIESIGIA